MVYPPLAELLEKNKINRYTLVVATAKCARKITDEYVRQREIMEKLTGKEPDIKRVSQTVNSEYRDEKAVQNAINELYYENYKIIEDSLPDAPEKAHEDFNSENEKNEDSSAEDTNI